MISCQDLQVKGFGAGCRLWPPVSQCPVGHKLKGLVRPSDGRSLRTESRRSTSPQRFSDPHGSDLRLSLFTAWDLGAKNIKHQTVPHHAAWCRLQQLGKSHANTALRMMKPIEPAQPASPRQRGLSAKRLSVCEHGIWHRVSDPPRILAVAAAVQAREILLSSDASRTETRASVLVSQAQEVVVSWQYALGRAARHTVKTEGRSPSFQAP